MKNTNIVPDYFILANVLLVAVTVVWGISFVLTKNALASVGPFWFIGIRFSIAFVFLGIIYNKRLAKIQLQHFKIASLIGGVLFASYAFQTIGLQYTTASNSGFITGLSVVLVPIVGQWWGQKRPNITTVFGLISSMAGLALLTLNTELRFNFGDIYTLLCAIALSFHIVLIGYYVSNIDPVALATFQIGIVAILGVGCGLVFEDMPTSFENNVCVAMAVTSIPGTALGFLIQNTMQRYVTTTRTAIIFLLEPVFAWSGAYFMLGEILTQKQMVGCILIIAGILISELRVFEKKKILKEA